MSCRSARDQPLSAAARRTEDFVASGLFEMQKLRREEKELRVKKEESRLFLQDLQQRLSALQEEVERVEELHLNFNMFLKDGEADQTVHKGQKRQKERLQIEADIRRLQEESAELVAGKQRLQREFHRHALYEDFMKRVLKMTKFKDVQTLTSHLESLLHFRDHLYRRESEAREKADRQRKALLTLEDQHQLLKLCSTNQLSLLQTELDRTRSGAHAWEKQWNHIQETAAKKMLLLGLIKIATLNLYEVAKDGVEGEESVDINDAESQLEKVKMFLKDHKDIVNQHQTPSQQEDSGKKRNKPKRRAKLTRSKN